jgi:hypothetical protein
LDSDTSLLLRNPLDSETPYDLDMVSDGKNMAEMEKESDLEIWSLEVIHSDAGIVPESLRGLDTEKCPESERELDSNMASEIDSESEIEIFSEIERSVEIDSGFDGDNKYET